MIILDEIKKCAMNISWDDFEKIDIRVGTIRQVTDFPKAKKPAFKLLIDFGEMGLKNSSAQITNLYSKEMLAGMQVVAVVNFPPKRIADFLSECLVLGVYTDKKEVVLLGPQQKVVNGWKIG
jgi:tRNA-binding protein